MINPSKQISSIIVSLFVDTYLPLFIYHKNLQRFIYMFHTIRNTRRSAENSQNHTLSSAEEKNQDPLNHSSDKLTEKATIRMLYQHKHTPTWMHTHTHKYTHTSVA